MVLIKNESGERVGGIIIIIIIIKISELFFTIFYFILFFFAFIFSFFPFILSFLQEKKKGIYAHKPFPLIEQSYKTLPSSVFQDVSGVCVHVCACVCVCVCVIL